MILILNALGAVILYFYDLARDKGKIANVHFLVVFAAPVVGGLFLLGTYLFEKVFSEKQALSYADISFDATRHKKKMKSNFIEEVDILPLEEAFAVSNKSDRRRALLTTLKRDFKKNISTVQLALDNEDSETSHYAASVILTTTTDYLNLLYKYKEEFDNAGREPGPARNYLDCLVEFINSNILNSVDRKKYTRILIDVMEWLFVNFIDEVTEDDFVLAIELLTGDSSFEEAAKWSRRGVRQFPESDAVYYSTMKMNYTFGNNEGFRQILKQVMNSSINVSNQTLETIRFFTFRQG